MNHDDDLSIPIPKSNGGLENSNNDESHDLPPLGENEYQAQHHDLPPVVLPMIPGLTPPPPAPAAAPAVSTTEEEQLAEAAQIRLDAIHIVEKMQAATDDLRLHLDEIVKAAEGQLVAYAVAEKATIREFIVDENARMLDEAGEQIAAVVQAAVSDAMKMNGGSIAPAVRNKNSGNSMKGIAIGFACSLLLIIGILAIVPGDKVSKLFMTKDQENSLDAGRKIKGAWNLLDAETQAKVGKATATVK